MSLIYFIFHMYMYIEASKVDFAGVILWDTSTWSQTCTLEGHTLTATQSDCHTDRLVYSLTATLIG